MSESTSASDCQYSLWLLPCAEDEHILNAVITRLAKQFSTPIFAPHVTIQGDLSSPREIVSRTAERIAIAWSMQRWPVTVVETSTYFFRSLYLRFDESTCYLGTKATAQTASGTANGLSIFPHLSLAYGIADGRAKNAIATNLATEFAMIVPSEIRFDRIAVARASKDVPINEWVVLDDFALAGRKA